jgi:hypothetical protein
MNDRPTNPYSRTVNLQVKELEVEGYVLLPGLLSDSQVARLHDELRDIPMREASYCPLPIWSAMQPQWHSRAFAELIGHPPAIGFLQTALGPDILFVHGHLVRSLPGTSAKPLTTHYKPYGASSPGWRDSSPVMLRVQYYLDDAPAETSAFRLIPRSNLALHADGNPYRQYATHPSELTVPATAGDAIVFNPRAFHGATANTSENTREMLEFLYRPEWAKPLHPLAEWDPALVAEAPQQARPYLRSVNSGDAQASAAALRNDPGPGLDAERWGGDATASGD